MIPYTWGEVTGQGAVIINAFAPWIAFLAGFCLVLYLIGVLMDAFGVQNAQQEAKAMSPRVIERQARKVSSGGPVSKETAGIVASRGESPVDLGEVRAAMLGSAKGPGRGVIKVGTRSASNIVSAGNTSADNMPAVDVAVQGQVKEDKEFVSRWG